MSKRLKNILTLVMLMGMVASVSGQVNDANLWTEFSIKKQFSKPFAIQFTQEFRFNENISELGTVYSEISAEYRINKFLEFSGGYRLIYKRRVDDSYSERHRYFVDMNLRKKFNRIYPSIRLRYQSQYTDINRSEDWQVPKESVRTKLTLKYDTQKSYTPYITGEALYHLNHPEGPMFNNYRLSAGVEYEFSKRSSIDLEYIFDREVNENNPWTNYVISIGWSYRL